MKKGKRFCSAILAAVMTVQLTACLGRPSRQDLEEGLYQIQQITGIDLGLEMETGTGGEEGTETDWYVNGDLMGIRPAETVAAGNGEEALRAAAGFMGITDEPAEVLREEQVTETEGQTFYRFSQICGGIPVYGRSVNLAVSESGEVTLVTGNYSPVSPSALTPEISYEEAKESVSRYLTEEQGAGELEFMELYGFTEDGLCVYDRDPRLGPRLAYDCRLMFQGEKKSGGERVILDAVSGQVLHSVTIIYNETVEKAYSTDEGKIYPFQAERSGDIYTLRDESRNISVYSCGGDYLPYRNVVFMPSWATSTADISDAELYALKKDIFGNEKGSRRLSVLQGEIKEKLVSGVFISNEMETGVVTLSNVQKVYEFYRDVLGRYGYNGQKGTMKVAVERHQDGDVPGSDNAASLGGFPHMTVLMFNTKAPVGSIDVVAHEFTHSVEQSISSMEYSGESGGLMEGYSDVFGELAEAYDSGKDPDWENRYRVFHRKTGGDQIYSVSDFWEGIDSHYSSTIISYAMYLLWSNWRDGGESVESCTEMMANLLYRTLFLLQEDAEFEDWRWALHQTGQEMCRQGEMTSDQYAQISEALEAVDLSAGEQGEMYGQWVEELTELAVMTFEQAGQAEEVKMPTEVMEAAACRLIPEIQEHLSSFIASGQFGISGDEITVRDTALVYYLYALYGEEAGNEIMENLLYFMWSYDETGDATYTAPYEALSAAENGWKLDLGLPQLGNLGGSGITFMGTLTSPEGGECGVQIYMERGDYTGAFFNGYHVRALWLYDMAGLGQETTAGEETGEGETTAAETTAAETAEEPPAMPAYGDDGPLKEKLAQLAAEWGIVHTGTKEFFGTGYGGGEVLVPAVHFRGLLCGDIWDYDGDGANELMTVKLSVPDYQMGKDAIGEAVTFEIFIYDRRDGDTAEQTASYEVNMAGLTETPAHSAIQFFRGTVGGETVLYIDTGHDLNTRGFAVRGLSYDGQELKQMGGADGGEGPWYVHTSKLGLVPGEGDRLIWVDLADYNWEGKDGNPAFQGQVDQWLADYEEKYLEALETVGLRDSSPETWGPGEEYGSRERSIRMCKLRPVEHFESMEGSLTELCGVLSPSICPNGTVGLEMTWYDSSAFSSEYR